MAGNQRLGLRMLSPRVPAPFRRSLPFRLADGGRALSPPAAPVGGRSGHQSTPRHTASRRLWALAAGLRALLGAGLRPIDLPGELAGYRNLRAGLGRQALSPWHRPTHCPQHFGRCQRRYSRPVDKATGLRFDQTVVLTGFHSHQAYPEALRRIGFRAPQTGKALVFLTNNFTEPALTIAQLYRCRWLSRASSAIKAWSSSVWSSRSRRSRIRRSPSATRLARGSVLRNSPSR